ncbi:MAG: BREX-1 system adenine-specific DNA-methyltransferase PglX [Coriobacteriaceae bacterium]|nr:BREX-1 system adenine-specific DNA-methyltransferase PglX [Coriobacteriaceae bacterium]
MESSAIKDLVTGVRQSLRAEVSGRLDAVLSPGSRESLERPEAVRGIARDVESSGRDKVVDRAAYTWFNRLCALRFMDANGYTTTPVVTPRPGSTQPAILADASQGVYDPEYTISPEVRDRVTGLLSGAVSSANAQEEAYAELLSAVCDRYSRPMPYLFKEEVASSLLMPQSLLSEESILRRIVEGMDLNICKSVEVLGWLYQFYIAERKDEVLSTKKKCSGSSEIGPATQLFTPDWIVKYLVDNSVGRLWMLNNKTSDIKDKMTYYCEPGQVSENHQILFGPEEISVCDPACGSGHILVYAFDLLFSMYEEEGWAPEDIPAMILKNNLFGFEIDNRAAEIASFALEMKAREKDPYFFDKGIDANIVVLEAIHLSDEALQNVGPLAKNKKLIQVFEHLDEVGSLYIPTKEDIASIEEAIRLTSKTNNLFESHTHEQLLKMLGCTVALSKRYSVVVANPPYMGKSYYDAWLSKWIGDNYPNEKEDLCTCFISRGLEFAEHSGYSAMVTMHSWMSLKRYENMRKSLFTTRSIVAMAHLGARAFDSIGGEVVQTTATIFHANKSDIPGIYIRLVEAKYPRDKQDSLQAALAGDQSNRYEATSEKFLTMPECIMSYQASRAVEKAFNDGCRLDDVCEPRQGAATGNNERYVRMWWEVSNEKFHPKANSISDAHNSGKKWSPFNKGGQFRKWYGNNDCVIAFDRQSYAELLEIGNHLPSRSFYFKPSITWSKIASGSLSMRYKPEGHIFSDAGMCIFANEDQLKVLQGFLNSSVVDPIAKIVSPTLHFEKGQVALYPFLDPKENRACIIQHVNECRAIAQQDWDSFEESWDFKTHPIIRIFRDFSSPVAECAPRTDYPDATCPIEAAFSAWQEECARRFSSLKQNEQALNSIFASLYGMENEVNIFVEDDKVSSRLADRSREMKSLISYAVGCIFGRYSTAVDGLLIANQGEDVSRHREIFADDFFEPDADNILPVLDGEWFEDDIVSSIYAWLASVFGEASLDANVAFIEESIGQDLRSYLVNGFYSDHLKIYQKRPIYWMFQSPKKSFQCLIYLHRYNEGTVGEILTQYLRPYQEKLRARVAILTRSERTKDINEAARLQSVVEELENWERDVIYPLAHQRISLNLDDGVKSNYNKFPKALAKVASLSEWK